jgi:hypothetical protein
MGKRRPAKLLKEAAVALSGVTVASRFIQSGIAAGLMPEH